MCLIPPLWGYGTRMEPLSPPTPSIRRPIRRGRNTAVAALFFLLALVVAACSGGTTDGPVDDTELPTWIDVVTPEPGADATPAQTVSVEFRVTDTDHEVRLLIDGVDVTAGAIASPGLLTYTIDDTGIITIGPGDHTAEVQLVTTRAAGIDGVVIDSYEWTFRAT